MATCTQIKLSPRLNRVLYGEFPFKIECTLGLGLICVWEILVEKIAAEFPDGGICPIGPSSYGLFTGRDERKQRANETEEEVQSYLGDEVIRVQGLHKALGLGSVLFSHITVTPDRFQERCRQKRTEIRCAFNSPLPVKVHKLFLCWWCVQNESLHPVVTDRDVECSRHYRISSLKLISCC